MKLAAAILGVPLFGGGALPAQYYPCGRTPKYRIAKFGLKKLDIVLCYGAHDIQYIEPVWCDSRV